MPVIISRRIAHVKRSNGLYKFPLLIVLAITFLVLTSLAVSHEQTPPPAAPTVKITSPNDGDKVSLSGNLTITGTSSDSNSINCQVAVIVNDVKPYQASIPTGPKGSSDYSQWKFTLGPNYTSLKEGQNKITSRAMCPGNGTELTKWFGINVTGVTGMPPETTNSTSTQQDNDSAKSSGPVYSYSQHKNTSKDISIAAEGQTRNDVVQSQDDGVDPAKNKKTQSTQPTSSNNQTQQATDFIPPFTTP
jgi:Big-like domain-containing protein